MGSLRRERKIREGEREDEGSHPTLSLSVSLFFLPYTHTQMQAMSFRLSVSYINLPVNPADPNDPSTAAPRDGGEV